MAGLPWLVLIKEKVGLPVSIPYRQSDVWNPQAGGQSKKSGTCHWATTPMTSTDILVDQKTVHLQRLLMAAMRWDRSKRICSSMDQGRYSFFFPGMQGALSQREKTTPKSGQIKNLTAPAGTSQNQL